MSPAETEQLKLRAGFLNAIGSSSVVASVITPAIGLSIGAIEMSSINFLVVATACGFWSVVGFIIHLFAVRLLGKLE
ncbi:hypothetical protein [Devosia enhydra]|uniref:hypothetical protein n=1 Tax=Devosia enhydra TaxID=665118 RepID=UPI0011603E55|nr:hypothetical protein [Devosia enhydra]